jgi:hypothetical protein
MTRKPDLTEKVQTDPEAQRNIGLGIAIRLAREQQVEVLYFDDAKKAWLALRDFIADEKIRAEGDMIERRGLQGGPIETHFPNVPIPSGEAGNLILLDTWAGFTETVLGPDETYRFHNGQGRYWKRVRLLSENLLAAFPRPKKKGRGGRKRELIPERLKALKDEAFRLFGDYGDPRPSDAHEEFNSKNKVIDRLLDFAGAKPKLFPKVPSRTILQPHLDAWLEEFFSG